MGIKETMFLETDANRAIRVKEYLELNHILYKETPIHDLIHFDVQNLTETQASELKKFYKQLESGVVEKRHRKWDDKYHTMGESFRGHVSGKTTEEEVEHSPERE